MKQGSLFHADGRCLVRRVWRATAAWERMRGLLGRPALAADEGMLIDRCGLVHTFGMGYPIDLAFLDGTGRVRKTLAALAPVRMAGSLSARMTLELPPGGLMASGLKAGDCVFWREVR